ncbi:ketopantoate reductase family protein [Paenarthrobacter aurescens]|jgi:2-dehydropantoate 2-reductase|uniref:Ketopantoate reductase protein n=1 Tax=Paenarthrobacter aurescens (strain TC1) TaxID=290340 RepID=A1RDL2_PAEAT|nr:2-dehydropantoate 2-reductase N-terminal domain-containing protein [Paenarthrobacter aurescens]ABM10684.1 putative Ketopantoate reductase protein [Paenarthrobacter aurescens TC1]
MKYLIIGGGAIGSVLSAYMTKAGKDVTLITRGPHLEAIREQGGLELYYAPDDERFLVPVRAVTGEEYHEQPDVVILAVKAYAIESIYPLLNRVCTASTVVLPVLNALDIGAHIERGLEAKPILAQGEAYVACELVAPGKCKHKLDFFRIVFGPRADQPVFGFAALIKEDLIESGCTAEINEDMLQAALMKFCRVSAISGAMVYYNAQLGEIKKDPEKTEFMIGLCKELIALGETSGHPFPPEFDAVEDLRYIVAAAPDDYRTSLMYDYLADRPVEWRTMFQDPYLMGRRFGLEMPSYGKVCEVFDLEGSVLA